MVSRVPTYITQTNMIARNTATQALLDKYNYQTVTGFKGDSYDVYSSSVNRVLSFESQVALNTKFIDTNSIISTREELALNSVEQITAEINNFQILLNEFASQDLENMTPDYTVNPPELLSPDDQASIDNLQQSAFNLLKSMETYLNIQADNGYIFSGGENKTAPVNLPWDTLEEFQAVFDGNFTTFPTTSAANLSSYDIIDKITGGLTLSSEQITVDNTDATTGTGNITITNEGYIEGGPTTTGTLTFEGNVISADTVGAFDIYEVGDTFTVTGTGAPPTGNDGLYTVQGLSDDKSSMTVQTTLTNQTIADGTGVVIDMETTSDDRYILSHITAENLGAFSDLKEGSVVTIEGTAGNNETYYISNISSDGRTITILGPDRLEPEEITAGTTGVSFTQDPNIGYIDALNQDGETINTIVGGPGVTGNLVFDNAAGTITAETDFAFNYVKPGQTITITGTGAPPAGNDGTHYVKNVSADGKTVTLETPPNDQTVTNGVGASIELKSAQHGFVADNVLCSKDTSGTIYFDETKNEMVATLKGAFSTVKAGDTIVVNGTENNNGVKIVEYVSEDGKTVIFSDETPVVAEAPVTDGTGVNLGLTYPIGTTINMSDIDPRYDGTYTIVGVADDGNRLIVSTDDFPPYGTPETFVATGEQSIASSSYYQGGSLESTHRIDETSTITTGLNAEYEGFEKAIRALGMICTGNLVDTRNPMDIDQTTYGVDTDRAETTIEDAILLLEDALNHNPNNFTEGSGDLQYAAYSMTMNITTLTKTIENQTSTNVFLQNNIDSIEKVNQTEAAAIFQATYNNLEISMAALSKMLNLSLLNFL